MILGFGPKVEKLERPMRLDQPLFASASGEEGRVTWVYAGNLSMGAVNESGHLFAWGPNRHGSLGVGHMNHQFSRIRSFYQSLSSKHLLVQFIRFF
uniref:Uncharacterized protein n=1 Tax=Ditylenchus dipsaci TaxID=166011 RepID=A0A915CWH9_9BILA